MLLPWLYGVPFAGLLAVLLGWGRPYAQAVAVLATAVASAGLSGLMLVAPPPEPLYAAGGWAPPAGIWLAADPLARLMAALTGAIFVAAALSHLGQTLRGAPSTRNPVYHLTFPLLLLALNGVFVTADWFNFYVCFELVAVASYLLVALGAHAPLEAAWKYSAQSVVGSICLLAGVSLLYGESGTLAMGLTREQLPGPLWWAAPFFLVAFLLKGAIFPFHFWQPDAHAAATTPGSMLLAGLLIAVGAFGLMRFWSLVGAPVGGLLAGLGAVSIVFGAVAAYRQPDAKRLLGYSSISQLGYVLLAIGWGTPGGWAAGVFYLIAHALGKALLFAVTGTLADAAGSTSMAALRGAGTGRAWLSAAYLLGVLSLAGLPVTVGFIAKLGVVSAGAGAAAWGGVAIALAGSLLTLAYGLKAYTWFFWSPGTPRRAAADLPGALAIGWLGAAVLALGIVAEPLYAICAASRGGPWP